MRHSALIGCLQFYRVGEDSRNSYGLSADYGLEAVCGIDQFIGEVARWNRAIRRYEKSGLRKVKLLGAHEMH